jgi:hypothetical protein
MSISSQPIWRAPPLTPPNASQETLTSICGTSGRIWAVLIGLHGSASRRNFLSIVVVRIRTNERNLGRRSDPTETLSWARSL